MKKTIVLSLALIVLLVFSNITVSQLPQYHEKTELVKTPQQIHIEEPWYQQRQIYNMLAFAPDHIQKYHITVNGLWNGFFVEDNGTSSPFALGRFLEEYYSGNTYNSDYHFVETQHQAGLKVPATILTIQGHQTLQGEDLETYASRDPDGNLCPWDYNANSYWMNILDPGYLQWCIEHGKKAIDANADMIVLDEIQGNGLIPMYQWASQYIEEIKAPGFSNQTIESYRTYLADTYTSLQLQNTYNIDNISSYDLKTRIMQTMHLTYQERLQADNLFSTYDLFLEETNYQAKTYLIEELRAYAQSQGKDIVITANSYALGTPRDAGFWPKGLHFCDHLDFFSFENTYTADDDTLSTFPRNKWLAWEKLAYASTQSPPAVLIDTNAFTEVTSTNSNQPLCTGYKNYLGILAAECFANRGSFVNYYFRIEGKENNWENVERICNFVQNNQQFYDDPQILQTDVAILYLYSEGMRTKSDTYLGCAQALAESDINYDVVFSGDDNYIEDRLIPDDLSSYEVLLIPNVINITDNQQQIISNYVESGGVAIVFDNAPLNLPATPGEHSHGNGTYFSLQTQHQEDIGSQFYRSYSSNLREKIAQSIQNYTAPLFEIEGYDGTVVGTCYQQEDRLLLHLVNYDYGQLLDVMREKNDISIQIKQPSFEIGEIIVYSIDSNPRPLSFTRRDGYIEFTVPSLRLYDLVVLQKNSSDNTFSISNLQKGGIYVNGKQLALLSLKNTFLIGPTLLRLSTIDEAISHVRFYLDGKEHILDESYPYYCMLTNTDWGKHTIHVVAYDKDENVLQTESIDIFKIL